VASVSSGAITAFGSVFVNGLEYATDAAVVIDDDTLAWTTSTTALEVGQVVDVEAAAGSTPSSPAASALHVHPLVRGAVDASTTGTSTLTVMGQTVQLTAATVFSDHRACLTASTSPCTAITGQSGLSATNGTGASAVPGNYVGVDGYLYASGAVSAGANVVATLVSIDDAPTAATGAGYKTEGVVTAVAGSAVTIGALSIDLSHASCTVSGTVAPCDGAFAAGQVVSAFAAASPALPAISFTASTARLRNRLPVETAGVTIALEGQVSSVSASAFVIRGVTVDASALSATTLPVVGDDVRVLGTVAAGGTSITASALTIVREVPSASYGFAGAVGAVVPGTAADTYVLTLLGQSIAVNAATRLADRSAAGGGRVDSTAHPFNITTFQTYLAASASQSVVVQTAADASGDLTALSVVIVPSTTVSSVSGVVDAMPAPANSTATGTPTTFSVHGVAISADPTAIVFAGAGRLRSAATVNVAEGDYVFVRGAAVSGTVTVAAASGALTPFASNIVIDDGVPASPSTHGCF
jgi:hypothetical protein